MKINEAIVFLNLHNKYNINKIKTLKINELKKKYHILALEKHPDKNNNYTATEDFQNINTAFTVVKNFIETQNFNHNFDDNFKIYDYNINDTTFIELIINFIKLINNNNSDIDIDINSNNFKNNCWNYTKKLLDQFFKDMDILKLNYFIWIFDNDFIIKKYLKNYDEFNLTNIKNYLYDKVNSYEIIYIKPNLHQIYNSFIHKLELSNNTIIVPLWHKELICDKFIIKINPELSYNIKIDNNNNLHYYMKETIYFLITKYYNEKFIPISINNIIHYNLPIENIIVKNKLTIICKNIGIPRLNTFNILDNTLKGDVILHINL